MGKLDLADKTLVCKDCEKDFTFSKEEQSFYLNRAYAEPKRCQPCRKRRKKVRKRNRRQLIRSLSESEQETKKQEET